MINKSKLTPYLIVIALCCVIFDSILEIMLSIHFIRSLYLHKIRYIRILPVTGLMEFTIFSLLYSSGIGRHYYNKVTYYLSQST